MADSSLITITGRRLKVIFENGDSSYMVVKYDTVEGYTEPTFIATGYHLPDTDAAVKLSGQFEQNGRYGLQLKVQFSELKPPDSKEEFIQYITSLKAGFGPKKAEKLFNLLAPNAWERLEKSDIPTSAQKIAGTEALQTLCRKITDSSAERDLIRILNNKVTVEIADLRADGISAETIRINPYILCKYGPTFQSVDEFALTAGYAAADSPRRIESALHAALRNAALRGSSCLTGRILLRGDAKRGIEGALSMLNRKQYTVSEDMAHGVLMTVSASGRIVLNSGRFYSRESLAEEIFVAKRLYELAHKEIKRAKEEKYLKAIKKYEEAEGITLSDEQNDTVLGVGKNNAMIVTGYPGAGKTTTIKAILKVLHDVEKTEDSDIMLLSPTGRAARRMEETTGHIASTVLSALGYTGRNTEDILRSDWTSWALPCKYVIVDELSMVDLLQMTMLLKHIGNDTQLIMIGDPDQLPSVGAGNVLHDLIASGEIPVFKLVKIFRQKSAACINPIPLNAAKIRKGQTDLIWIRNEEAACVLVPRTQENHIFNTAVDMYRRLVTQSSLTIDDVALLCPFRKKSGHTILTSTEFNLTLQKLINPVVDGELTMTSRGIVYHKGDKVMQLVNKDYAKNGDVGYVDSVGIMPADKDGDKMEKCCNINFNGTLVQCNAKMMGDIDLAYASSVHKMQGSEVDTVILVIAGSHSPLLARNLVYTAITRAIKHVVVVGDVQALNKAIERDNTVDPDLQRLTLLDSRLHNEGLKAQGKK